MEASVSQIKSVTKSDLPLPVGMLAKTSLRPLAKTGYDAPLVFSKARLPKPFGCLVHSCAYLLFTVGSLLYCFGSFSRAS